MTWVRMSKQQMAKLAAQQAPPPAKPWGVERCCPDHDNWLVISKRVTKDLDGFNYPPHCIESVKDTPAKARYQANKLNKAHEQRRSLEAQHS